MAAHRRAAAIAAIFVVILCENVIHTQVLTPPYFNLAVGRRIEATSTCGESVAEKEWFCKLTGANPNKDDIAGFQVIQGQLCDFCDPTNSTKSHPAEYAIDGSERWWQSPPLSRGLDYNEVNLTLNFEQEFHVAYVFMKMGNAPRPGVFVLERSTDHGQTWKPWQYFADTESDCNSIFGAENYDDEIEEDNSVLCATEYSKVVPLEGGEIVVSLVNNRPSANNFSYSQSLQEWTRATNVRLRLLRTKTLLGHLMAVAQQDPTVTRRYYYSIKDISIGGRCVCNGHADVCDKTDPFDRYKILCQCQHNTCGDQCERCCPGFIQKPWKPATLDSNNDCEACQCFGHSNECYYDDEVANKRESLDNHGNYDGGGVCVNCQHNTEGINCEKCVSGYYHPVGVALNSTRACEPCRCDPRFSTGACHDGTGKCTCRPEFSGDNCDACSRGHFGWPYCQPCVCNVNGTEGQVCDAGGGQCPCKPNYDGYNCDRCAYGFYGFPDCQPCACDRRGSIDDYCDPYSGECRCKSNFGDRDCGMCLPGFYNYPNCDLCSCDRNGATKEVCDQDGGFCLCKENFGGAHCDMCARGYFNYPECIKCGCQEPGFQEDACDNGGQCVCKYNFAGRVCDRCAPGYYNYPECKPCDCDQYGSYGITCDQRTGQCDCRRTFEGLQCDKCGPSFYNYPVCEECNCNPAGAKEVPGYPLGGCGAVDGRLCECKDRVGGRICDTCRGGYWNLNINNAQGCEDCQCYRPGTTGWSSFCDVKSGQCVCKPFASTRTCDQCSDGTYNMQESNVFGCEDCKCDIGGSLDHSCNKNTGECNCRPRVNGRTCNEPMKVHYFPTLYQHLYEMESGSTQSGRAVRYGFDTDIFPGYSWRGYAILSRLQEQVQVTVDIKKPSLYRLIFRYVNTNPGSVTADITVTPDAATDVQQSSTVLFSPSYEPTHVTVSGSGIISTFVLNPGKWTISLKTPETLYVDYLVLLPQAYYEATVLQESINTPCRVPEDDALCKHYVYVDVSSFSVARGETGYVRTDDERDRVNLHQDQEINQQLGTPNMAHVTRRQPSMQINLPVSAPGKYVLVFQYHSTRSSVQDVDVAVAAPGSHSTGVVSLPHCPYSSLCRQVVVDHENKVAEFDIQGNYASITLTGRDGVDFALDSIIAIPVEEWSIGFVQPKLKCIKRNRKCIESNFFNPTGSVRAEFEFGPNEDRVATDVPPHIIDTTVKVIKLDGSAPTVTVKASVLNPAQYVLVAHYYQPYSSGLDVDVTVLVSGQDIDGKFHAAYCPGVSGCRAVIKFEDGIDDHLLDLSDLDLVVHFNNTSGRPVWLDYIMVIPVPQFQPSVIDVQPVDKSANFITKCGENEFFVSSSTGGFCRRAVFTLTTEYNNGALPCDCDPDGSLVFSCEEFGGQCQCKNDVIGRTCSECRTGYYGFPNCRPCSCPSGLCDPNSGACVCPPRVTGENCDTCLPMTFGFDPLIGCEECSCDPEGVSGGDMECDTSTGQCSCKPNISRRRCDMCVAGYYRFPRCQQCTCDTLGTVPDICDQSTAECLCKENVGGQQCTSCKPSTFYLEDRNPKGCTTCFCFGTTSACLQSNYRRTQVIDMKGWAITNVDNTDVESRGMTINARIHHDDVINGDRAIYWVAPESYLGNKVTAYGGKMIYTVEFRIHNNANAQGIVEPDIRIEGNNLTLVYLSLEQPIEGQPLTVELDLLETKFKHESTGAYVKREQFMMVLARIESMQIRASYYDKVSRVSLTDVQLDIASPRGSGALARNVEQCQCPPNYVGTSCEQCAPGYYRSKTGPYLGVCVPCECNGKADICDPDSGKCVNCRDNFSGPQCISCKPGHYQDPYSGTCVMCSCPMRIESNNFASTCQAYGNGDMAQCECLDGYRGRTCEICDMGYWGDPNEIGKSCEPCQCSGNIDIRDPLSCDIGTGACLRCINDADGQSCERCRGWYWGDAIGAKDCQQCTCDPRGSEMCEHQNGDCLCKPNVVGENCDSCDDGAFGFGGESGCELCDCALASYGADCNMTSGQCECRPGVTGRRCDRCKNGHWNYGARGCDKCNCEFEGATTCDSDTGRCQCLPGVTGPKCDQCLSRWVLIPEQGCIECDNCIHLLLDDVEVLSGGITTMKGELESVNVGVGAIRRLESINSTVHKFRPLVDSMIVNPDDDDAILDPIKNELTKMIDMADTVRRRADMQFREAELAEVDAADVREDAETLDAKVRMAAQSAEEAVSNAKRVLADIEEGVDDANLDRYLEESERMLEEIKSHDFSDANIDSEDELINAEDVLERAREVSERAMEQENRTSALRDKLDKLDEKLLDLMNSSRVSKENSETASDMNFRNERVIQDLKDMIDQLRDGEADASMMVDMAREFLNNATSYLDDATQAYRAVEETSSQLDAAMDDLETHMDELGGENNILRPIVDNATEHALRLQRQAEMLDSQISDTRHSAESALNASHAYRAIVEAISSALNASGEAIRAAQEARDLSNGLADKARESLEKSEALRDESDATLAKVSDELAPRLDDAKDATDRVEGLNGEVEDDLGEIVQMLDMLPEGGYSAEAEAAADKAIDAEERATAAQETIQDIMDRLPEDEKRVEQISLDVVEANRDIKSAQTQVDKVLDLVPHVQAIMDDLSERASAVDKIGLDLTNNISALRDQIRVARGEASRIKVGVSFDNSVTLMVRNPQNIANVASKNVLSLYFNTEDPNGFLAYVGPDKNSNAKTVDYLSLELIEGRVVFKFDLGAGPGILRSTGTFNEGKWHEVIVERNGKKAKLTVRTDKKPDDVSEGESPGTFSLLDFTSQATKFYIGGVPQHAGLEDKLNYRRFSGCIEDVKFDEVPVGLWDFVHGENNINGCVGRGDELPKPVAEGFKFSGDGYIILERKRYNPSSQSSIILDFKTFSPDGLLFLWPGQSGDFLSLELRDGRVVFKYDLGTGNSELASTETYNDGKWHSIVANRIKQSGLLKVDDRAVKGGKSPGQMKDLSLGDGNEGQYIYIGGYKGTHAFTAADVTNMGYTGCIKGVQFGTAARDLNDYKEAKDILEGCPDIVRIVSFMGDVPNAYIAMNSVSVDENFEMTMKVKTTEKDGLLFYTADDTPEQENAFSVSMVDGYITVIGVPGGPQQVLESSEGSLNDGRWHYITVLKEGRQIRLGVDDRQPVTAKYEKPLLRRIKTTTPLYFGGAPPGYTIITENIGTDRHFQGCIGDVTVNGAVLNFAVANPSNQQGALLGDCPFPDLAPIATTPSPFAIDIIFERPVGPDGGMAGTDQCALPLRPVEGGDVGDDTGTRFGSQPYSRYEFSTLPETVSVKANFSVEFKTTSENGIIFYIANERQVDFIALYLKDGKLNFAFDCGSGHAMMTSAETYSDGEWHMVEFSRERRRGKMIIDDGLSESEISGRSEGNSKTIDVSQPYFVGGLNEETADALRTSDNTEGVVKEFTGCLRNLKLNDGDFGEPSDQFYTQPCSASSEVGTFFYDEGGYLVLDENFKVGLDLYISMEVKARTLSGVLMSVHSVRGDYLVIQLVDGEVVFNVDNGEGEIMTKYEPTSKNEICNGRWFTIEATKAKNVVTLNVNRVFTYPGIGKAGVSSTDTNDPLYIGGLPESHAGVKTRDQFVGCIRNLKLNDDIQNLSEAESVGRVGLNSCPAN